MGYEGSKYFLNSCVRIFKLLTRTNVNSSSSTPAYIRETFWRSTRLLFLYQSETKPQKFYFSQAQWNNFSQTQFLSTKCQKTVSNQCISSENPRSKYIIMALTLMSYGSNCCDVSTVSQYCLLQYFLWKGRSVLLHDQIFNVCVQLLVIHFHVDQPLRRGKMTRVIRVSVLPYENLLSLREWKKSVWCSHLLCSSQKQQKCRAIRPIIKTVTVRNWSYFHQAYYRVVFNECRKTKTKSITYQLHY